MPRFGPVSRRELIIYLRRLDFDGPFPGARHQIMAKGNIQVTIPNPHEGEISRNLLAKILRIARVNRDEWEML
ncbi:MAG: type II toxin-antitoxin system HicA family toxin [Chloroflexota bacterium]